MKKEKEKGNSNRISLPPGQGTEAIKTERFERADQSTQNAGEKEKTPITELEELSSGAGPIKEHEANALNSNFILKTIETQENSSTPGARGKVLELWAQGTANPCGIYNSILESRPKPGVNFFAAWDSHSLNDDRHFHYKVTKDYRPKYGHTDSWIEVKAEKSGETPKWIRLSDSTYYREHGYDVPDKPEIIGLDFVSRTDRGDYVFITENPLDYWVLNHALSRDRQKTVGYYSEKLTFGCAIMPYDYDFSKAGTNEFLTKRKVVVVDYGNHDQAKRTAERISMQKIAESVHIWEPTPEIARGGIFRALEIDKAHKTETLNDGFNFFCDFIRGEEFPKQCQLVKVEEIGGALGENKRLMSVPKFDLYPYLTKGKINILAGAGGTGKSQIATEWAVRIVKGQNTIIQSRYRQDDFGPQNVLWMTREEDLLDCVYPRALQYGINASEESRFFAMDGSKHPLGESWYQEFITRNDIKLIIFDSFQMFVDGDTNSGDSVVNAGRILNELARATGVTVLLIHHFNKKSKSGTSFADLVSGRHEIRDMVRTLNIAIRDPEDDNRVVVFPEKKSYYRGIDKIPNLIYEIKSFDERDSYPQPFLVGTDFRSETVLSAQMKKREETEITSYFGADEAKGNAASKFSEYLLNQLETYGYIAPNRALEWGKSLSMGEHQSRSVLTAFTNTHGLRRRAFGKTVFHYLEMGGAEEPPDANERVYINLTDAFDTPESIARIASEKLEDPITHQKISELNKNFKSKSIKAALDLLVKKCNWIESDGEYYAPEEKGRKALEVGSDDVLEDVAVGAAATIGSLRRSVTLEEATEMAGDRETALKAFEILVRECGFTRDRENISIQPPIGMTKRSNNQGQQIMDKGMAPLLY